MVDRFLFSCFLWFGLLFFLIHCFCSPQICCCGLAVAEGTFPRVTGSAALSRGGAGPLGFIRPAGPDTRVCSMQAWHSLEFTQALCPGMLASEVYNTESA